MFLRTSANANHKLYFITLNALLNKLPLSKREDCLNELAEWFEKEWGYIRNMGIPFRRDFLNERRHWIYVGIFAKQPVAMFALQKHPTYYELLYVCVKENCRGFSFGKQIIEKAKQLARELEAASAKTSGAEPKAKKAKVVSTDTLKIQPSIWLDTLKPRLNRMYEKHGARVVGERTLFSHPIDILVLPISEPDPNKATGNATTPYSPKSIRPS